MYRSIIIPLDGSPFGEHAVPVAAEIARRSAGVLRLAHVVPPIPRPSRTRGARPPETRLDRDRHRGAREYMDAMVERVAREEGVMVTGEILEGEVVESLLGYSERANAELIVLTTHGRSGLGRVLLGSVADALTRASDIPVLAVRSRSDMPNGPVSERIERVLVPLDGSERDEQVVAAAKKLGATMRVEFLLLRIVTPTVHEGRPTVIQVDRTEFRTQRADAEAALAPLAQLLEGAGHTVRSQIVLHEQPDQAILSAAEQHGVDLIAMATRGRGGLQRVLKGSVADRVLRGTTGDVLLVRDEGEMQPQPAG